MSEIQNSIQLIKAEIPSSVTLIAVSKTKPNGAILDAYKDGQRIFGENKAQELSQKYEDLPKDIEWHLIGHLQTNKVKYIAPFVSLIHAVDSFKLLKEINKQALKNNRVINCLLQIKIADEESKFGLNFSETELLLNNEEVKQFKHVNIIGLMGMSTNTFDEIQVRNEFESLHRFYSRINSQHPAITILSMGMSNDYKIAIKQGSTMVRIGSTIFGSRN